MVISQKRSSPGMFSPAHAAGLSVVLLAILSVSTHARNAVYRDALSLWGTTVRQSPYSQRSVYNYGYALFALGKDAEAIRVLRALESGPAGRIRRDHLFLQLGISYFRSGSYEDAATAFRRGLIYAPHDAVFLNNLAMTYLRMGQYAAANDYVEQALKADSSLKEALYTRGEIHLAKGEYDQAAAWFLRAIEQGPDDPAGYWHAAQAYARARRYDDARRYAGVVLTKTVDGQLRGEVLQFMNGLDEETGPGGQ